MIGIYVKTFSRDFDRLTLLLESIETHWRGGTLPITISAPKTEIPALRDITGSRATLVADEDYAGPREEKMTGWQHQQVCKLSIFKLGLPDVVFVPDSDFYFTRPFSDRDFISEDGVPSLVYSRLRTVYSEANALLHSYVLDGNNEIPAIPAAHVVDLSQMDLAPHLIQMRKDRDMLPANHDPVSKCGRPRDIFRQLDMAWAAVQPSAVLLPPALADLQVRLLDPLRASVADLIRICPWEYHWHAEWVRATGVIHKSTHPFFLHFQSDADLNDARRRGYTSDLISDRFLGVQMAGGKQDALVF